MPVMAGSSPKAAASAKSSSTNWARGWVAPPCTAAGMVASANTPSTAGSVNPSKRVATSSPCSRPLTVMISSIGPSWS